MKADVKYNDLKGTAAADVTDFSNNSLQNYLASNFEKYDADRYECRGCTIWVGGQEVKIEGNLRFICYDKYERKYVRFQTSYSQSLEEIFSLFKRFDIVIGKDVENIELDENDVIEL